MIKLVKYLLGKRKYWKPPAQLWSPYNLRSATPEQLRLMTSGRARTPAEAQRVMDKLKVHTAAEAIVLLPRRTVSVRQIMAKQTRKLVLRVLGIPDLPAQSMKPQKDSRLAVTYKTRNV